MISVASGKGGRRGRTINFAKIWYHPENNLYF